MRAYTLKEQWDNLSSEKKWEEYLRIVANLDDLILRLICERKKAK